MFPKPRRQVQNHANHRGRHGREGRGQFQVVAQLFDVWCAEKDPEEARHKGDPGGDGGAEGRGQQRRQISRVLVGTNEPDELQHHHERSRRGFREPQAIHHLRSRQPTESFHRLLTHVGQHGVSTAEGHHRRFAEKDPFANHRVTGSQPGAKPPDRQPPKAEANADHDHGSPPRGSHGRHAPITLPGGHRPMPLGSRHQIRPPGASQKPHNPRSK